MERTLTPEKLEALRSLSTCMVANAIETFNLRLRNTGFADASLRCFFENLPPTVGYATTARVRTSVPPMQGHSYYDRTDWWASILAVPEPRVVVVEDVERHPGLGSLVGTVHANILRALGCVAFVTNGGVRDLTAVEQTGLQFFAGNVAVSHSYAHIFEFGTPVQVGGLRISPGDLLHGDRHWILQIPRKIAEEIPAVATQMLAGERKIIDACHTRDFSLEKLRGTILEIESGRDAGKPNRSGG